MRKIAGVAILAVVLAFCGILIVGFIYYCCLVTEVAVMKVDKAATDLNPFVLKQIEKDNKEIEEMKRFHEWLERKRNREYRERQRR